MHRSAVACGLWSRAKPASPGFETCVAYPAHDGQALARLHEGQAVVTGDNDGLLAFGAAVERGHGVARVRPEEHAAHRAVEARRLTHSDHRGWTSSLTRCDVLHRHLPYSLHGEPGKRAVRVAQHEGARSGGGEHGDHERRVAARCSATATQDAARARKLREALGADATYSCCLSP